MPVGWLAFTGVTVGISAALGMVMMLVGVPIAVYTLVASRWFADYERRRAAPVLGGTIPALPRERREGNLLQRWLQEVADIESWRGVAWAYTLPFLGTIGFTIAVTVWAAGVGYLLSPVWMWALPDNDWHNELPIAIWMVAGGALLAAAPWIVHGSSRLTANVARAFLSPSRAELEKRVQQLTSTRTGAVHAAEQELQRIERDLHDGAQARLVALALDLGMAKERIERDPKAAAALVDEAHAEAKRALAELRDLARGIHPAILSDRGLDGALSALAARSPVHTVVDVKLPGRPTTAAERAAYFTVAEALTNVAKHSEARQAAISAWAEPDRLVVEVADDGRGGAEPARGSGITGLRGRVEALDGHLLVVSPPGEGTTLRAEIPCAW